MRFVQHLKSLTDLFAQTPPEKTVGYVAFKSHSVPKVDNGFLICKAFAVFLKSFSVSIFLQGYPDRTVIINLDGGHFHTLEGIQIAFVDLAVNIDVGRFLGLVASCQSE